MGLRPNVEKIEGDVDRQCEMRCGTLAYSFFFFFCRHKQTNSFAFGCVSASTTAKRK